MLVRFIFMQPRIQLAFWAASAHVVVSCSVFCPPIPSNPSPQGCSPPLIAQPVFIFGTALTQVQGIALDLDELHYVCMGPPLKPVQDSFDGIPSLQHVDRTMQLGVVFKFAEGALSSTVHVTTKLLNNISPNTVS